MKPLDCETEFEVAATLVAHIRDLKDTINWASRNANHLLENASRARARGTVPSARDRDIVDEFRQVFGDIAPRLLIKSNTLVNALLDAAHDPTPAAPPPPVARTVILSDAQRVRFKK